jgi:hypothetical protein
MTAIEPPVEQPRASLRFAVQRAMAWTGPIMLVLWVGAFIVLAKFIPPPDPQDSAREVLNRYADDTDALRIGLVVTLFASALLVPFAAVISTQMRRIEGGVGPLSLTQVVSAGLLSMEFIVPIMVWLTAAYRGFDLESARTIQMLNDMGWLMFVAVISSVIVQIACFGAAILIDDRAEPIFPRWSGYFMLWVCLLLSPTALCVFFKHGPFAWNGLFAFYVPLTAYATWMIVTYALLRRAIDHEQRETFGVT